MNARIDLQELSRNAIIYGQVMGSRGPKPVNTDRLKEEAELWASFFYRLRDGQSGYMQRVKWGEVQNTGFAVADWTLIQPDEGSVIDPANMTTQAYEPLGPPIPIPVSEAARTLPLEMRAKDLIISRPVMPAPELWKLLRQARSVGEIRKASREIRKWLDKQLGVVARCLPGIVEVEFCDALDKHSEQVLLGKRLPHYPKTARPGSDDKRIQFFAKVLAGAQYGLAPITAVKRLSHCNWPRDSAEKARLSTWSGAKTSS